VGWFVLNFFLLTSGELCLAPVGMSMVTKLAPLRIVGVMMGAFFLAYSASSFIASRIAQLTTQSIAGQLESYAHVYTTLGCVALAAALLLWLLAPLLTRRMHEPASIEANRATHTARQR
jgi:POT family proton-dependent oligopeptide transporter